MDEEKRKEYILFIQDPDQGRKQFEKRVGALAKKVGYRHPSGSCSLMVGNHDLIELLSKVIEYIDKKKKV
jgi:hypothetical protein